jgi:hypothetical protein
LLFISCSTVPLDYGKNTETISIPIVLHLRTEADLEKATVLINNTRATFLEHNIEVYVHKIVFRDNDKLDVIGAPNYSRPFFNDEKLDIFFVDTLYDEDLVQLFGAHIKFENSRCRSYVLIPEDTSLTTIAHEIGHEYGLEHTYGNKDNIMKSNGDRNDDARFTKEQAEIMKKEILKKQMFCS